MAGKTKIREIDLAMAEHLQGFLPCRIFDSHTHMHVSQAISRAKGTDTVFFRDQGTPENYWEDMRQLLPGVEMVRLNMMPMPDPIMNDEHNGLRRMANEHVENLQRENPKHVYCPYILPCDREEQLETLVTKGGAQGFKCYCYGAGKKDLESLGIEEYLPQAAWEVAQKYRLPMILHMMRHEALSDPDNFSYICTMAKRYPHARLVLAHCARGFASWTVVEKIQELEDCGNIWFDLSAVCESGPMMACILKNAGKRTMWGSDYPICLNRGRAVSIALGQNWLLGEQYEGPERALIAMENLMAFYQAALLLDLDRTQVEDIFYYNAMSCFACYQT